MQSSKSPKRNENNTHQYNTNTGASGATSRAKVSVDGSLAWHWYSSRGSKKACHSYHYHKVTTPAKRASNRAAKLSAWPRAAEEFCTVRMVGSHHI
jgi:hypothetical protein